MNKTLGVSWYVTGGCRPYDVQNIRRFVLNPDMVVSMEVDTFGFRQGPVVQGTKIILAATTDVYTRRNDSYEASLYQRPAVEVTGGGSLVYTVLVPLEDAARLVSLREPFPIPEEVADWLVRGSRERLEEYGSRAILSEAMCAVLKARGLDLGSKEPQDSL